MRRRTGKASGVVLLEVVLALTLFAATAATVGAAMNRCSDAAVRLRIRARAADLAVTLLSEIQLGLIEPITAGPTAYEHETLLDWTWEVETEDMEDMPSLRRVRVTATHTPTGLEHALTCLLRVGTAEPFYGDGEDLPL